MQSGSQTSTETRTPWAGAQPYLTGGTVKGVTVPGVLPQAANLYANGQPSYFPGSTVAGFSPAQTEAQQFGIARAENGSPLNAAASGNILDTINGAYLNPSSNPYLGAIQNNIAKQASGIAGQFESAGRTGSGAAQESIAQGVASGLAPYQYGTYNTERGNQMAASQFAPTLANQDWQDIANLSNIGQTQQQQGQSELSDVVNRYNYGQNEPYNWLAQYASLINGTASPYGTATSTQPTAGGLQTALGAGLGLAGLASTFFSSEKMKKGLEPVDTDSVTDKLADLPISRWTYKGDKSGTRHMGPMAGEFKKRFGVGDGVTLHPADMMGVMMAASKEQAKRHRDGRKRAF